MYSLVSKENYKAAIEELTQLIVDIAWKYKEEQKNCSTCRSVIDSLIGILGMITGNTDDEFFREIIQILE